MSQHYKEYTKANPIVLKEVSPVGDADALRHKIVETFEKFRPALQAYSDYAEQISALSLEYHDARLAQFGAIEEGVLALKLDSRETPKSLDTALAQIPEGCIIRRIVFDRPNHTYYLFT